MTSRGKQVRTMRSFCDGGFEKILSFMRLVNQARNSRTSRCNIRTSVGETTGP